MSPLQVVDSGALIGLPLPEAWVFPPRFDPTQAQAAIEQADREFETA